MDHFDFDPNQYNAENHLQPIYEQVHMNVPPEVVRCSATGDLPSREEFAGDYDFNLEVGQNGSDIKRQNWQYSLALKKAFFKVDSSLPVRFKITTTVPPAQLGLYVRAVVVFTDSPDFEMMPVQRCPLHTGNSNYVYHDHVLLCSSRDALYDIDHQTRRHSVRVYLAGPQAGSEWENFMYTMMCLNSCKSINRLSLAIIFTLERELEVVGRRVLAIRVCAAPKRDCVSEEKKILAENGQEQHNPTGNENGDIGPSGPFFIPVLHPDDYVTLAKEAKELVEKDYPDGYDKSLELEKYDQIILHYGNPSSE